MNTDKPWGRKSELRLELQHVIIVIAIAVVARYSLEVGLWIALSFILLRFFLDRLKRKRDNYAKYVVFFEIRKKYSGVIRQEIQLLINFLKENNGKDSKRILLDAATKFHDILFSEKYGLGKTLIFLNKETDNAYYSEQPFLEQLEIQDYFFTKSLEECPDLLPLFHKLHNFDCECFNSIEHYYNLYLSSVLTDLARPKIPSEKVAKK